MPRPDAPRSPRRGPGHLLTFVLARCGYAAAATIAMGSCGSPEGFGAGPGGPTRAPSSSPFDLFGDDGQERPFRGPWTLEYEGPFRVLDDHGQPRIRRLSIGSSLGFHDNFSNRGDVIVLYDGPPDRIKIEFRRFTTTNSEAEARKDFDRLSLWAYALGGNPQPPQQLDEADRCDVSEHGWRDDCSIQLYYRGQTQLMRAGADIRVTLPADYRQTLEIRTADNVADETYPNRGNVCVEKLAGSVDIQLQSGEAFVSLARDITPSPACSIVDDGEALADCMAKGWDPSCHCIVHNHDFGQVRIRALAPSPANMTVDAPEGLWTTFHLENTAEDPAACSAVVDGITQIEGAVPDPKAPWRARGQSHRPATAPSGGGFSIDLESPGCAPVAEVESPEAWDPDASDLEAELRGVPRLCAGCLAENSCETLLSDG